MNFVYQPNPRIDKSKSIFESFSNQKRCDVTFVCKDEDDNWIKIGAHKFYLSLVSEVFDTMFYLESIKNEAGTDNQEIKIEDISFEAFKLFLGFLYNGEVEFEHGSKLAEFYYAAHKYSCSEALQFATQLMLTTSCPKYVSTFHHIAVLHDVVNLKEECEKIMTCQTDEVLRSSELLKAAPETINFIFSFSKCAVNSELDFIWALERYINFNHHPEIPQKVRPALQAIRFLTLTPTDITTTSLLTSEEKKAIIACLSSNDSDAKMPESFSLDKTKRKRGKPESSVNEMIQALREIFVIDNCCYCAKHKFINVKHPFWMCPKRNSTPHLIKLKGFYEKYQHTDLLHYNIDDIKRAYKICLANSYIKEDAK